DRAADAAEASTEWTRLSTRADVVAAYFGAVLADDVVRTYETAEVAATAHVRQAQSMATNGLVTSSDALLASVRAGEVETKLLAARGDAANGRHALLTLLGAASTDAIQLPSALPDAESLRAIA